MTGEVEYLSALLYIKTKLFNCRKIFDTRNFYNMTGQTKLKNK